MKDLLHKMISPKTFRFLQSLWFGAACGFAAAMVYCLLNNAILAVGYCIGGILTSTVMYFVNGMFAQSADSDNTDSTTSI